MSEKHLTELPWKTLVTKQGVKDIGLGKALVSYGIFVAANQPAKALESLKEIIEFSGRIKKTYLSKTEVVAHLDEVVKEAKKTVPGLEAAAKSAAASAKSESAAKASPEDDDEAKEAAEFKKDLKQQMISALAQVKARAPGDPKQQEPKAQLQFMAYVAAAGCAVVVARKVGAATKKLLPDLVAASGGQFMQGECIFEQNAHTFVLAKVPGGLAKKLATALLAETGQKYKVRVRSIDGSVTLDSDTDLNAESSEGQGTASGVTSGGDDMAKFTARFKVLQPNLVKAIATRTPQGDQAKQRAVEAGALAAKKDFTQAHRLLDEVDALVTQVLATAAPTPQGAPFIVRLQKRRLSWVAQRKSIQAQLQELERAIMAGVKAHNDDESAEDEFEEGEVTAGVKNLYAILDKLDERLVDKLDEALNAQTDEQRQGRHREAAEIVREYQAFAISDPILTGIDENGFTKSTIRGEVLGTLSELAAQF